MVGSVKVFKDTRTNKLWALEEHTTMGNKVCLVPFERGEDKFVSPSTLKRWFTRWGEEPVLVEVSTFTGMKIGLYPVAYYDKDSYTIVKKNGICLTFSRSHDFKVNDKQSNAKNPKFANQITRTLGYFTPTWLESSND